MKYGLKSGGLIMGFNEKDEYWVTRSMLFPSRFKIVVGEDSYVRVFNIFENKVEYTFEMTGDELICQLFDYIGCNADFE